MPFNFKYLPTLRGRQQELLLLDNFDFGDRIYPMLEIIKEKDRVNNSKTVAEIWLGHIGQAKSDRVLVDLPVYIRDTSSMQDEVLTFNRTTLSNIERRIEFFRSLQPSPKTIPVISTLLLKTGEVGTITTQITALRDIFPVIAVRTFTNTLDTDLAEITETLTDQDILIYDLDTVQPYSPLVRKQLTSISAITKPYKIALRSAINSEIQNTKLDHEEIVADADNSLVDVFNSLLKMNGFGDYAGIKKDDLNAGGTISPGFIFFDPIDNLYYGYKGEIKDLAEFEDTIVPAVLNSKVVTRLRNEYPEFVTDENLGYKLLMQIQAGQEKGKSQAKFKRIAMEHYLFCIKTKIAKGDFD